MTTPKFTPYCDNNLKERIEFLEKQNSSLKKRVEELERAFKHFENPQQNEHPYRWYQ